MSRSVIFVAEDDRLYSHSPNVLVWSDPHSAGYRSFLVSTLSLDDPTTQPWETRSAATPGRAVIEVRPPVVRDTITTEPKKGAESYIYYFYEKFVTGYSPKGLEVG